MNSFITRYGEWLYRSVLLSAVCVGLYLNSRYVTRDEFAHLQAQVTTIEKAFAVMVETNRINDLQRETLRDHEVRLRLLEQSKQVILSKP